MKTMRNVVFLIVLFSVAGCTDLVSQSGGVSTGGGKYGDLAVDGDGSIVAYSVSTQGGSILYVRDYDGSATPSAICISFEQFDCSDPDVNGDGHLVVFASVRDDLVPNDDNGERDVFLFNRRTSAMTRISELPGGDSFKGRSHRPAISADGNVIAFETNAENVPGYPASTINTVVVYTVSTGTFQIGPLNQAGARVRGFLPDLSADGAKLSFSSRQPGLVSSPIGSPGVMQVYQQHIATGVNTMVSVMPDGSPGPRDSLGSRNTGDGGKVLFFSDSEFLGDPLCPSGHLWVRTMSELAQQRVTVEPSGICAFNGNPITVHSGIASDIDDAGEFVVFSGNDSAFVASPDASSQRNQVYRHTLATATTKMISTVLVDVGGVVENQISDDLSAFARISGDGLSAVYFSEATNLTDNITTADTYNVFRHDKHTDSEN